MSARATTSDDGVGAWYHGLDEVVFSVVTALATLGGCKESWFS